MNLELVTDLTKIELDIELRTNCKVLSYNLMCVPLNSIGRILNSDYICDFRNENTLVALTKLSETNIQFNIDLRNMCQDVNRLSFFILGDTTGDIISGVNSIKIDLLNSNSNKAMASIEIPNLGWKSKCINLCTFKRNGDSWIFKEICKKIDIQEFNCRYYC